MFFVVFLQMCIQIALARNASSFATKDGRLLLKWCRPGSFQLNATGFVTSHLHNSINERIRTVDECLAFICYLTVSAASQSWLIIHPCSWGELTGGVLTTRVSLSVSACPVLYTKGGAVRTVCFRLVIFPKCLLESPSSINKNWGLIWSQF